MSTAEKKLVLSGIGSVSPSMSDDVKLRLREKELLQAEVRIVFSFVTSLMSPKSDVEAYKCSSILMINLI